MGYAEEFLARTRYRAPLVPEARRDELRRAGYKIEDMGAEYGPSFEGQWRFINIVTADFQDDDTSATENCAWFAAHLHHLCMTGGEA